MFNKSNLLKLLFLIFTINNINLCFASDIDTGKQIINIINNSDSIMIVSHDIPSETEATINIEFKKNKKNNLPIEDIQNQFKIAVCLRDYDLAISLIEKGANYLDNLFGKRYRDRLAGEPYTIIDFVMNREGVTREEYEFIYKLLSFGYKEKYFGIIDQPYVKFHSS